MKSAQVVCKVLTSAMPVETPNGWTATFTSGVTSEISVRAVLARVSDVLKTLTVVLSPRDTAVSPGQAQHGSCHKGSACKFLIFGSSRGGAVLAVRNRRDRLTAGLQDLHDHLLLDRRDALDHRRASLVGGAPAAVTADHPSS